MNQQMRLEKFKAFVDEHLSNWYVRLCRRRFWKGDYTTDKIAAYQTLYTCLETLSKLMAPVAPFFSDRLYQDLNNVSGRESHHSIHLADLPTVNEDLIDKKLEERMGYAQNISSLVLSLRKKDNHRVRQPLQKILLPILDESFIAQVDAVKDLILQEVNVKEIEYITDTSGVLHKDFKPNYKRLGPKFGKAMKAAVVQLNFATQAGTISSLKEGESYDFILGDKKYSVTLEDFIITTSGIVGWAVARNKGLTVALDVNLTDELKAEGVARELVNRIQNLRKSKDFDVIDKILVTIQNHEMVSAAVADYGDYICNEVLANSVSLADAVDGETVELLDDVSVVIGVVKA